MEAASSTVSGEPSLQEAAAQVVHVKRLAVGLWDYDCDAAGGKAPVTHVPTLYQPPAVPAAMRVPRKKKTRSDSRKSYTVEFKLLAIREAQQSSKEAAGRKLGVDSSCIRKWMKHEAKLQAILASPLSNGAQCRRLRGAERKPSPQPAGDRMRASLAAWKSISEKNHSTERKVPPAASQSAVHSASQPQQQPAAPKMPTLTDCSKLVEQAKTSNDEADLSGGRKGVKHRSYSADFKLKAIQDAKRMSGCATARKYNVNPRLIRRWKQQETDLNNLIGSLTRKRLRTGASDSDIRPAVNTTEATRVKKCTNPARRPQRVEDVPAPAQTVNQDERQHQMTPWRQQLEVEISQSDQQKAESALIYSGLCQICMKKKTLISLPCTHRYCKLCADLVRTKCPDCYIDSQISSLQTSVISTDTSTHERGADAAGDPDADDSFTVSTSSQSQSASGATASTSQHADCLMSDTGGTDADTCVNCRVDGNIVKAEMRCTVCEKLLCCRCSLKSQCELSSEVKGHKVEDLDDVRQQINSRLAGLLQNNQNQLEGISHRIKVLQQLEKERRVIISKLRSAQASNSSVNDKYKILDEVQQSMFLKGDIPQLKLGVSHL